MLASIVSALCAALALPATWSVAAAARDVFHPEWLLAATLVVFAVQRAARACWWCALPAVVLPGAQLVYVVGAAQQRLEAVHVDATMTPWFAVVVVQVTLLCAAVLPSASASYRDRRWSRFMRRRLGPREAGILSDLDHVG